MKFKSGRHKETNTFKFQPFAERISHIDIDIFHRVKHENETDVENENEIACIFRQTIQKWNILNLTEGYCNFRKEVNAVITLPQLLFHKDQVFKSLIKHLQIGNVLSLQPLLELVVAFAKDLCKEFYPYYKTFLNQLIDLLNIKNTEVLEWTFQCLAYLFKLLWRYMLKDLHEVINSLLPLLDSSRPEYINNFAAESFAFVGRKIKDRETFLLLIVNLISANPDTLTGCARLLFEIIRGVSGQFHSCADELLPFYFESLSNANYQQSIIFELLEQIIYNIHENISVKKSSQFWLSISNTLEKFHKQWKVNKCEETIINIEFLLKLLGQAIELKNGKFLENPEPIINLMIDLIDSDVSEKVMEILSQISAVLLLSGNIILSQEIASRLTLKILAINYFKIRLTFIENVINSSSFEFLILPWFLDYCIVEKLNANLLHLLAKIACTKSPLALKGDEIANWSVYPLDFSLSKQISLEFDINKKVFHLLRVENLDENLDEVLCAAICLAHVKNLNQVEAAQAIDLLIKKICEKIQNVSNNNEWIYALYVCVETQAHLKEQKVADENLDLVIKSLKPFLNDSQKVCALRTLDLLLSSCSDHVIKEDLLKQLYEVLCKNLSSEFHEVRLLTTHILSLFDSFSELNQLKTEDGIGWRLFTICYNIELIKSDVQTYRDQLLHLSHLNFDKPQSSLYKATEYRDCPLRYLLGALYINFKLLWDPIIKVIASQAHGLNVDEFWTIFFETLNNSTQAVKINAKQRLVENNDSKKITCDFLLTSYSNTFEIAQKPDYDNYRILLWKTMTEFTDIIQIKNRDVSPLLLNFVETEYFVLNSDTAKTWNIKKNDHEISSSTPMENSEKEPDEDDEKDIEENFPTIPKQSGKFLLKCLLAHLNVFSKLQNPRNIHREPELYQLYLDFLMNTNSEIQKSALDCIMTYKHKYLVPYKDHLYALVDDKRFKNELALFRIDQDSEIVVKEHREDFIPIVLRIAYSKMVTKTGLRTGGKAGGQLKRSLVIQFLSGCQESEIMIFINMAFKLFLPYMKIENLHDMIIRIESNIKLDETIPPKKLQSTINLLAVILEKFGVIDSNKLLPYLLKMLLCIGSILKASFAQSNLIHPGYLTQLRLARKSSIETLTRFFEHYETYAWSQEEMDAAFDIFVWPYLNKLSIEGVHSPVALLKLCLIWSQNPRYFVLFVKTSTDENNDHILPHIIQLLKHEKTHITVKNVIMQIIEHLVTLQLDDEDKSMKMIPVKRTFRFDSDNVKDIKQKLNYGSIILLPHVSAILEKLQQKIAIKNKHLNKQELCILSRVSEMIFDQKATKNLINLLFPVLMKKSSFNMGDEEQIVHFVTTLCNLIQNVDEPELYLYKIAPLFSSVNNQQPRKLLCKLLETISLKNEKLVTTSQIINMINAWDIKWLDKPDSASRLEAFKEIHQKINEDTMELELGVLIIHNCFYLLRNDVTLLDSITHCLKIITVYLIKKFETNSSAKELIINGTLLQLIRNGFKDKNNETYRNESILLLGHLARECPESHIVLQDLECLTSKEDPQVDFFENLVHLQLLRHARALFRFNQVGKKLVKAPYPRTLTQFILPLVTHYLNDEKYANKNNIIDGAIEAVGIICRFLPWHQYELVLRYYLGKLRKNIDFQKQLVRLIISILDAFHFNLSKATNSEKDLGPINNNNKNAERTNVENEEDLNLDSDIEDEECKEDEILPQDKANADKVAIEKETILAPSAAKRLIFSITSGLLPQLHKTIGQMTTHEGSHKVNRKRTGAEREEEDLLRVPIALAVVKLLQKLPEGMLKQNLPGIFMKLCTFLKSPLDSVRRACREILQKIMITIGPKYLPVLVDEITPLMSRGFQVHVLVFTLHAVLVSLKDQFEAGDIDTCLSTILQLCQTDIFGVLAEEKEVNHIVNKTSEAKSTKSYDTFQILGQFITEKCFMDLLFPIKEVINSSLEYKKVKKAEECLRRIVLGLVDNAFISSEALIIFAYGTASASITDFKIDEVKPKKLTDKEKALTQDCFIIPGEPKNRFGQVRSGPKQLGTTNAHILVEFGLRLCYFILKREKLNKDHCRAYLDPFVPILYDCLNSKHVKLCTLTLHCLCWVFKIDLPSMKTSIKNITNTIFQILHKYAAGGLSKGDNFDLVLAAFKAMSVLITNVKHFILEEEQLKTILLYVEQDLHDSDRKATAFSLLKAIISRKFIAPELHIVMEKVARTSITSESANTRIQSRQIFHKFLMEYPLKKALKKHVAFYLAQLDYELQFGRESALEMILDITRAFPQDVLDSYFETFFITLGPRLINDDVPECRKLVATCLTTLLQRLKKKQINKLMEILSIWLKDKNISHRRLASQMCGIIVQVEKDEFERHLNDLLPLLFDQFTSGEPGKFVRRQLDVEKDNESEDRKKDHHLFQVLQLLLKLCVNCPEFLTRTEDVETLALHAQSLLAYPHEWVRLASAQFLGFVMTKLDPDQIARLIIEEKTDSIGYLSSNDPKSNVKSLILDLIAQLQVEVTKPEMAEQVIKNVLFLSKILKNLPLNSNIKANISLTWLIKKMRKIINLEVAQTPSVSILREAIFKWIGGVARILEKDHLKEVLYYLMGPLVRELNLEEQPCKTLKQLSKELAHELKARVGLENYTNVLTKLTSNLDIRRAERKRERAQIAVTNPEIAAKRKMKLQAKKQEMKKRKIANMKGVKYTKRRKMEDIVAEDNSDF